MIPKSDNEYAKIDDDQKSMKESVFVGKKYADLRKAGYRINGKRCLKPCAPSRTKRNSYLDPPWLTFLSRKT